MKKLLFIFLFFNSSLFAQTTFQRIYVPDPILGAYSSITDVKSTSDGGYIVYGTANFDSIPLTASFVVRLNQNGDVLWAKRLDSIGFHIAVSVGELSNGGYFFNVYQSSTYRTIIVTTDSTGNLQWALGYSVPNDATLAWASKLTSDEKIIFGGVYATQMGTADGFIGKINANGTPSWSKTISQSQFNCQLKEIIESSDGNYVAVGESNNISDDIFVVKTDTAGNTIWGKSYDLDTTQERAKDIDNTSDGGYLLTAFHKNNSMNPIRALLLIKTDSAGNVQWAKQYRDTTGNVFITEPNRCTTLPNNQGYVISGTIAIYPSGFYPYLMLIDTAGNFISGNYFTLRNQMNPTDFIASPQITSDGGYIINTVATGFSSLSFVEAGYLIKTNSLGTTGCYEIPFQLVDSNVTINVTSGYVDSLGINPISIPLVFDSIIAFASDNCSTNVGINDSNSEKESISIFPNPTTGKFTIETKDDLTIYNSLGQLISPLSLRRGVGGEVEIDLSNQSKGIYFIQIISEDKIYSQKIILQ